MGYDPKAMGARIREERRRNKLTIEKLCEMLEVSPSFIGLVERGVSGISLENLCKLSEIFKVSTDYLLLGEEQGPRQAPGNMELLNTVLYNYTDTELKFVIELLGFLKPRIEVKK